MPDAADNKQIVISAYKGMAGGDAKAFLAALDPEIEVHEPPQLAYGGSYKGHAEVIGFMTKAASVVAPGKMEVDHVVAEDDRVAALLRIGLQDGSEAIVSEHWLMRDGKAIELRTFWHDPGMGSAAG